MAAASCCGIRSSASETSSSNRCGLIRTATRLLPWRWRQHGLGRRRPWWRTLWRRGALERRGPTTLGRRRSVERRARRRRWAVEERVARWRYRRSRRRLGGGLGAAGRLLPRHVLGLLTGIALAAGGL